MGATSFKCALGRLAGAGELPLGDARNGAKGDRKRRIGCATVRHVAQRSNKSLRRRKRLFRLCVVVCLLVRLSLLRRRARNSVAAINFAPVCVRVSCERISTLAPLDCSVPFVDKRNNAALGGSRLPTAAAAADLPLSGAAACDDIDIDIDLTSTRPD